MCLPTWIDLGQTALVIGAGPVGLAVLLCLKAKTICISEIATIRKAQAESFGADAVIDPTQADVVTKVRQLCNG
jgi:(R,R)-butanediol dehydrogenase / meso-butanediol dehydrogenase / diacetyl reductase